MDDVSGRTGEEVGAAIQATEMVFKLTGTVYDNNGNLMPNQYVKADLLYWLVVGGASVRTTDTVHFQVGVAGSYVYYYKGQNNPIAWDASKGLAVNVSNDQTGWVTQTSGQFNGKPSGASPITVVVSDTIVKPS